MLSPLPHPAADAPERTERVFVPPPEGQVQLSRDEERLLAEQNQLIYEAARSAQQTWSQTAVSSRELYNGVHWTQEQKQTLLERGQSPVAINTTFQLVEQAKSMLTANNPSYQVTGRENTDVRDARSLSDLLSWIWQINGAKQSFKKVVEDYYVDGRGMRLVGIDPNMDFGKGEVTLKSLDPIEVYPDPRSRDRLLDDASYIIVRRVFTRGQVEAMWGRRLPDDADPGSTGYEHHMARTAHNDEQILQSDIEEYDPQNRLEVIERFQLVPAMHLRVFNPHTGREDLFSYEEWEIEGARDAFVVTQGGIERPTIDEDEVYQLQAMYKALGPVFHMVYVEPQIDPETGQPVEQPPVPVPGPEDGSPNAVPGSTTELRPTTYSGLVAEGYLPAFNYSENRCRVVASVGNRLLYQPFELPIPWYPIINYPNGHNRNPYSYGDVHRVKDLQLLVNKSQSLILAHAASSTNIKAFYPEGSITDVDVYEQQWGKAGTALIPYDPTIGMIGGTTPGGIVIAHPPPLPTALYENMDRALALMERIMGVFSLQQGDPANAPSTFKGTIAIDEFGMRRMKSKMDDLYSSLEREANVVLRLAQKLYTEQKVIRLREPSGQVRQTEINQFAPPDSVLGEAKKINDITVGTYDAIVVSGSTLPSNRWALLETYMDMYQMGLVDDIAVLRATELPDAEDILNRKAVYMQLQQTIQQQGEIIKRIQGDLQTAERSEVSARKRLEVEKFKAGLKEAELNVRKASQLFERELQKEAEIQKAVQRNNRIPQG